MARTPALASAPRISTYPLAAGVAGIAQTVAAMYALIDAGSRDPDVRRFTLDLLNESGVRDRDDAGALQVVYQWVQRQFRFIHDPHGKELIGDARYLLDVKAGDCDDYVVVLGAMLQSIGIPIRIATVRADKSEPNRYSHTYPVARLRSGAEVALDATQPEAWLGWEPPRHFGKKIWPVPATLQRFPGTGPEQAPSRAYGRAGSSPLKSARGLGDTSSFLTSPLFSSGSVTGPSQSTVDITTLANAFGTDAANIIAALRNPAPQYVGTSLNPNAITANASLTGGVLQSNLGLPSWAPWVVGLGLALALVVWVAKKK